MKNGGVEEVKGLDDVPHLAASGRTSFVADKDVPKGLYRAAGFRVCGERAVRVDILERLADLIRPAIAYRPGVTPGDPPPGAADGDGFRRHGRDDLARRLLGREFRLDPALARLCRRAPGRAGDHRASAAKGRDRTACAASRGGRRLDEASNAEESNVAAPAPEISENTESAIDAATTPRDSEAGETAPPRGSDARGDCRSRDCGSRGLRKPRVRKWRLRNADSAARLRTSDGGDAPISVAADTPVDSAAPTPNEATPVAVTAEAPADQIVADADADANSAAAADERPLSPPNRRRRS